MATIKELAQQILTEKETKIVPGKIEEDWEVFDVTGTLKAGTDTSDATATGNDIVQGKTAYIAGGKVTGTFGGDTKTFETTQQMYADPNPIRDGKALIYRPEETNINPGIEFTRIYFPETITCTTQVASNISILLELNNEYSGSSNNMTISASGFSFTLYDGGTVCYANYSSNDGLTYTRQQFVVEPSEHGGVSFVEENNVVTLTDSYDEGYYMRYTVTSGDADVAKQFFKDKSFGYYGLYKYKGTTDNTKIEMAKNIRLNTHSSETKSNWTVDYDSYYDMPYSTVQSVLTKIRTVISYATKALVERITDTKFRAYLYTYQASNGTNYSSPCSIMSFYRVDGTTNFHIQYNAGETTATGFTMKIYEVDLTNNTITDKTSTFTQDIFTVTSSGDGTRNFYYITTPLDLNNYFAVVWYNGNQPDYISPSIPSTTDSSGYSNWNMNLSYGKSYSYLPAETQFTLNSAQQLIKDVVALGSDGAYTGAVDIYNDKLNISTSTPIDTILPKTGLSSSTLYGMTTRNLNPATDYTILHCNNLSDIHNVTSAGINIKRRSGIYYQIVGNYVYQLRYKSNNYTIAKYDMTLNTTSYIALTTSIIETSNLDWAVINDKFYLIGVTSSSGANYGMALYEYDMTNSTMTSLWTGTVTGYSGSIGSVGGFISPYNDEIYFGYARNTSSSYSTSYTVMKYASGSTTTLYTSGSYYTMSGDIGLSSDNRYVLIAYSAANENADILIYDLDSKTAKTLKNTLRGINANYGINLVDGTKIYVNRYTYNSISEKCQRAYIDFSTATYGYTSANIELNSLYGAWLLKYGDVLLVSNTVDSKTYYSKFELSNGSITLTPMFYLTNITSNVSGDSYSLTFTESAFSLKGEQGVYELKILPKAGSQSTFNDSMKIFTIVAGNIGQVTPLTTDVIFTKPTDTTDATNNALIVTMPGLSTQTIEEAEEQISNLFREEEEE